MTAAVLAPTATCAETGAPWCTDHADHEGGVIHSTPVGHVESDDPKGCYTVLLEQHHRYGHKPEPVRVRWEVQGDPSCSDLDGVRIAALHAEASARARLLNSRR